MTHPVDLLAWLRLTLVPEVNLAQQLRLLETFKTAEEVLSADAGDIEALVGESSARALRSGPAPGMIDKATKWISQPNHHFVTLRDADYPELLREIDAAPAALYVQGRVELLNAPSFAIVGSRNATIHGARDAESLALALSQAGLTVVSGMALGIDAAAHRGGLAGCGSSTAMLGTGADRIYPRGNEELARRLAADGAIVSEFPLGTAPTPGNFPRRNRLISGLSRGVLVVEAALESGSLITARFALEQGRDVFAIPGSIHSPLSKGCHQLIKDGAKLVERADDILAELQWNTASMPQAQPFPRAPRDRLLEAMGHAPVSVDQIAEATGESVSAIAARLSMLEIEGAVAAVAGGFFQRLPAH